MRIVSTAYMALIDKNKIREKLNSNASWFKISVIDNDDTINVLLNSKDNHISFKMRKVLINKTTNRYKYEVIENDYLAFDHATVI
jgi:hypothetical protein